MSNRLKKGDGVPYAQIANDILRHPTLSLKAKGLYAYMYSMPDNWNFTASSMASQLKENRKTILSIMIELKEFGLLEYEKLTSGKGVYTIYSSINPINEPKSENGTLPKNSQSPKMPPCKNATVAKADCIKNKDTTKNKDLNKNTYEEEEINLDFIDDYINFITEGMQGVRRPTAYRKSIINKIQNRDKQTLKNYLDFCSDLLLLEETKNIDMAIFEDFKLNLDGVVYKCNFAGRSETNRVIVNYEGVTGSQQMTIHESQFFKSLMTA